MTDRTVLIVLLKLDFAGDGRTNYASDSVNYLYSLALKIEVVPEATPQIDAKCLVVGVALQCSSPVLHSTMHGHSIPLIISFQLIQDT